MLFRVKRQQLPLLLMLIAGAVTTITVYLRGLGLKTMLIALLVAFVTFYLIGSIIKAILDNIDKKNEEAKISEEGEVIEKESDEELKADGETAEASEEKK